MDLLGVATLGAGGFALGAVIGLTLRAISRIILYALGLYLISLLVLASFGLIIVNWDGINSAISKMLTWILSITELDLFSSLGVLSLSTLLGTLYGLTRSAVVNVPQNYRFFKKL